MKVNPISTNIHTLKKKTDTYNAKEKSQTNNSEKQNNDKLNFMSGISFKGYTSIQHKVSYGTSGCVINEGDVDKGWHSSVKTVKKIDGHGYFPNPKQIWNKKNEYKVYISDVNEKTDPYFLPDDIDFFVEYQKPEDIYLNDIRKSYKSGDINHLNFDKHIDYEWAWKDQYQKEYNEQASGLNNLTPLDRKVSEGELRAKSDKMYVIGQKIDKMEYMNSLLTQAKQQDAKPIKKHYEMNKDLNRLNNTIDREITENEGLYKNIDDAQKIYDSVSENKKEEAGYKLTAAKVKKKMIDYKVKKNTNGTIKSLDECIDTHKDERNGLIKNINELEQTDSYKKSKSVYDSTLSKIEDVYNEFFYDKINR